MKTKDLNFTDVYATKARGNHHLLIDSGWSRMSHTHDYRRQDGKGSSLLMLAIHPEQREILRDDHGNEIESLPDAKGNFIEGPLVDWASIAQDLRDELVGRERFQTEYPTSKNFLKPRDGYFVLASPQQLSTLADYQAAQEATKALNRQEAALRNTEISARLHRFEAALTGAGISPLAPLVPRYPGYRDTVELTLDQLVYLLGAANQNPPTS